MSATGQKCTSISRIFVVCDVADEFCTRLEQETALLRVGDGARDEVDVGPLIAGEAVERASGWVTEAVKAGGRAVQAELPPEAAKLGGHLPEFRS